MLQTLLELDSNILLWIQDVIRSDILTPIVVFITHLGDKGAIWMVLAIALAIPKKTRRASVLVLMALLVSYMINNVVLKNAVARTRPYEVIDSLQLLIQRQKDFSFPSGHTASSFAAAVVFYRRLPKKYGVLSLVLAVLISLSRLYVGVHYPSDVLCGAISGTVIALMLCKGEHILLAKGKLKYY